jgi:hypothetical protein
MFAAAGDENVFPPARHTVFGLNGVADSVFQFIYAPYSGIPGLTAANAFYRGVADILRSIAIGLPDTEIDNADAVSFERLGFGID